MYSRTTFYFEQSFGEDAAGHADRLANVVARVFNLDVCDGQLAGQRHGKTTRLWRLLDREEQDLERRKRSFQLDLFAIL